MPPENGISQGNYAPVIQLVAPEKLQVAVVNGTYEPNEKTNIFFELAGSRNDLNLFSNLDDGNNDGFAGRISAKHQIVKTDSLWNVNLYADADNIKDNYITIQRLYRAEFNRDWNLESPLGNQSLISSGAEYFIPKKGLLVINLSTSIILKILMAIATTFLLI